ncbi:site-specific integrase [Muricauda sp. 334s03]|uniref:Site-specific integrase n=1 Tax=Flagellimonas yonaguniensis TaxID=3031325 RepID=A0ABT5Y3D2_9FLAO|nr:site-specific integrase [[Muricauda] yonaguniensis]MDF0717960.1 site-specific integrase [[Muricauda] yonaguniensis]
MSSIKITLRNKPNKDGEYPVVMRVIKNRRSKIITIGLSCYEKDWDTKNLQFKRSAPNHVQRNRVLLKLKEKALKIIDEFYLDGIDFTLEDFENKFRGKKDKSDITVLSFWDEKVEDLIKAGKAGNARAYRDAKISFFKFESNKKIRFNEITPALLDKYETHLRSRNNTNAGISIKMRTLRALYNDAMKKNIISIQFYPFKVYKISKLKSDTVKRALTIQEMKEFKNLDTSEYPHLLDSKNYFMFSFYTRGMNYIDMMKLRWEDVHNDRIVYRRSKTGKRFIIKILEPVREILDYYKGQPSSTGYIFPMLLKEKMTPMQIEHRKDKTLKKFNRDLKEIAKVQGINKNITSYVARHSYATYLKQNNVSTDKISESMGHANLQVTINYLKEFGNDVIDDANDALLDL